VAIMRAAIAARNFHCERACSRVGLYERTSGAARRPLAGTGAGRPNGRCFTSWSRSTRRRCSPSCAADPDGGGLSRYVERELAAYLKCGILAHGFLSRPVPDVSRRDRRRVFL
jgi:hypothetical protein